MQTTTNQPVALRRILLFSVPAALGAGLLLGSSGPRMVHAQENTPAPLTIPSPSNLSNAFSKIAAAVGPAVVNVSVEILPKPGGAGQPDQLFGGGQETGQAEQRGLGSGFIVDPHGYIVTNNHVVEHADSIYVKLSTDPANDRGHRAMLVGTDPETDLAVIKIDAPRPLPTVKLGNSESAAVGDWVEAIGSPFDLSQTVTTGIVSAKNRSIGGPVGGQFKHYLQTDAAINLGNSGGPLLDMAGEVVGVNTAIASESGGSAGIGFAIPSSTVAAVYNQLTGPGHKVVRGSLGIGFQASISPAVARLYHADSGVLVGTVTPGKPADRAGLRPNDVITTIDGKPVKNGDALVADISERRPGTSVRLGYLRDGRSASTTCSIGDRAELTEVAEAKIPANPAKAKLGLAVRDLPEDAPRGLHGVLVEAVQPGSFADELSPRIVPGLVIREVNRKPVANKREFDAIVAGLHSGDSVVLEVAAPDSGRTALTGGTIS